MKALLALEDERIFYCRSFTGPGESWGEVVFNTGMTGYQEVLTDPSYKGQMVTMTYPLIGNYGVNPDDIESDGIQVSAFIIKEYQEIPSNHRATDSLAGYLKSQNILGIEGLDTRALTRHIRKKGALRAFISTLDLNPESCIKRARSFPAMTGMDLAREVTTEKPYYWAHGKQVYMAEDVGDQGRKVWRQKGVKPSVVAFDFGIKFNILRCLENSGFEIIVVPAATPAENIRQMSPDGIFLSNGPGDPEPVVYAISTVQELIGYRPMFGICLGHQLMGIALGGETYKLKFGHRGANQPVKNLLTGKIEITSQNHGFAVNTDSIRGKEVEVTHVNLNDNTLEGFRHKKQPLFAVQYHPEASPGPHDARYLFDQFRDLMKNHHP